MTKKQISISDSLDRIIAIQEKLIKIQERLIFVLNISQGEIWNKNQGY